MGVPDHVNKAELKRNPTSWLSLTGLGVSYVIAGDYTAWNFGFSSAGWAGMMIAVAISASIWIALMMTLAELSSVFPTAGGGFHFASNAFGAFAGKLTGFAIMVEYGSAAAVVAIFIEAYFQSLTGISGWPIIVIAFAVPVIIHLRGAKEAMGIVFGLTATAVCGIFLFVGLIAPSFSTANLFDVLPQAGHTLALPNGWSGVWIAMPFATAFFLAIEGIAMAAEEVADPGKTLPRAMIASVVIVLLLAILVLISAPGGAGAQFLSQSSDPLPAALAKAGVTKLISLIVSGCGLIGLSACLFAVIFALSRQVFALAREGHLPQFLARTGHKSVPVNAILVSSVAALAIAFSREAQGIFVSMVFAATVSYVLMTASHIRLRLRDPTLARRFRTPGGIFTSAFALICCGTLLVSCMFANPKWSLAAAAALFLLLSVSAIARYYGLNGREFDGRIPSK